MQEINLKGLMDTLGKEVEVSAGLKDTVYTLQEIATLLDVSTSTVSEWLKSGRLSGKRDEDINHFMMWEGMAELRRFSSKIRLFKAQYPIEARRMEQVDPSDMEGQIMVAFDSIAFAIDDYVLRVAEWYDCNEEQLGVTRPKRDSDKE